MESSSSEPSEDRPLRVDVAVVGGGLAGLSAARALVRGGLSVRVLEARERVGGRTLSRQLQTGDVVDLGAQWLGPGQDHMDALAKELGLHTFAQHCRGTKVLALGDKLSTYKTDIPSLSLFSLLDLDRTIKRAEAMAQKVPAGAPERAAEARLWDGMTVETWKNTYVYTAAARAMLDVAVESIFAVEPAELSLLFFLSYLQAGGGLMKLSTIDNGAQQTRVVEGCQAFSLRLAEELGGAVWLRCPVRAIAQDEAGVTLHCPRGEVRARFAVVAVPPLLAGQIDYAPELPQARQQLTARMPMGSAIKCVAVYPRPFWRERGFSGEAIADSGPVRIAFDDSPDSGTHGALLAFVLADSARQFGAQEAGARKAAVISALVRLFGDDARHPVEYVEHDWSTERWSGGCYTGVMAPGTLTRFGAALRTPVGRLHWAGTETAERWTGYMDGAVSSGLRAAQEVLSRDGRPPQGRHV